MDNRENKEQINRLEKLMGILVEHSMPNLQMAIDNVQVELKEMRKSIQDGVTQALKQDGRFITLEAKVLQMESQIKNHRIWLVGMKAAVFAIALWIFISNYFIAK